MRISFKQRNADWGLLVVALLVLLAAFVFLVEKVSAEPRYGLDTLAAAKYPKVLRVIPNHIGIGGFAETFGDFYPVAMKELKLGREFIRVQFIWSDSHSFGDKDLPTLKRLANKYAVLCEAYPGKVEVSPFCEHNVSNPDKYLDYVQALAPKCSVINTPWKGALSKKYKNEIHGNHATPAGRYNYSFDGTNAVDSNVSAVKAKHSRAEWFFIWTPRLNLKWSMKDATPRPQRKAFPTEKDIKSYLYLLTEKGKTKLPKGWLLKSHAERHELNDLKGDKLLFIAPQRDAAITLKRNGKIIDTLRYYGTFDGGGFRYYSTKYGFENGKADIFIHGKKVGNANCGFRDGSYR